MSSQRLTRFESGGTGRGPGTARNIQQVEQQIRNCNFLIGFIVILLSVTVINALTRTPLSTPTSLEHCSISVEQEADRVISETVNRKARYMPIVLEYDRIGGQQFKIEQFVPFQGQFDLNTVGLHTLAMVRGIGQGTARSIIDYRKNNRGFKHVSELLRVDGIGQTTYLRIAHLFFVSPEEGPTDD
ncbi:helix-hairpin-helix domain-containing protein [bacterium]|nr:helix-hairpin-helix domain-containing protein [bacterium]